MLGLRVGGACGEPLQTGQKARTAFVLADQDMLVDWAGFAAEALNTFETGDPKTTSSVMHFEGTPTNYLGNTLAKCCDLVGALKHSKFEDFISRPITTYISQSYGRLPYCSSNLLEKKLDSSKKQEQCGILQ